MEYKRVTQGKITKDNVVLVRNEYNAIILHQDAWDMLANAYNKLSELEDKIEQGTLFEMPFIWKSKKNSNEYIVVYEDEQTGHLVGYCCVGDDAKEKAEEWLKELQNG